MTSCVCCCSPSPAPQAAVDCSRLRRGRSTFGAFAPRGRGVGRVCVKPGGGVRASMVDSYESSSGFIKRMEQAWLISQQPRPISCSSCHSRGHVECQWCRGTGFFILGDNMLCQVPSRNTSCVICAGKGSACCADCKGTGYRAKWLGDASSSK